MWNVLFLTRSKHHLITCNKDNLSDMSFIRIETIRMLCNYRDTSVHYNTKYINDNTSLLLRCL